MGRRRVRKSVVVTAVVLAAAAVGLIIYAVAKVEAPGGASSAPSKESSSAGDSSAVSSNIAASSAATVSEVDTSAGSLLMLVNKDNSIPESYSPELETVAKKYYYSSSKDNHFDARAAKHLEDFIDAGKKAGFSDLCILSGYRTRKYQQSNFDRHVKEFEAQGMSTEKAKEETAKIVAPPGTSEHETGLAADIITSSWYNKNGSLTAYFDKTKAFKWLTENAAKYGFILRYPEDKVAKTGYSYESWHFRYVGTEAAQKIADSKICLEEYVSSVKK